ncbi:helix-turn-helix domain-containing protein [Hymenobacter lucidus]|uniref:Helix-turn-helix domain-containing protein n=1 Tax=Hymenobacter lucidus TaxID=2880930 RepID=A0ABS8ANV0_9BACT|nr:helix-turn-helix domain-containing protein [Hymenobacter lucidus]MCB2407887.1 helix-turn-helix domain-containing protein [Hymenobacter lucidus]
MPRRSQYSDTLSFSVRQHFALTQTELARFVGVSRSMLAAVEAGRKELGQTATYRLLLLGHHLPPPEGHGAARPSFGTVAAEDGPPALAADEKDRLRLRLKQVRVGILTARAALEQRGLLAQGVAHRHWALAELRTVLTAPAPSFWPGPPPDTIQALRWLDELAHDTAFAPVCLSAAEHTLRLAHLRGLEAELLVLEAAWGAE